MVSYCCLTCPCFFSVTYVLYFYTRLSSLIVTHRGAGHEPDAFTEQYAPRFMPVTSSNDSIRPPSASTAAVPSPSFALFDPARYREVGAQKPPSAFESHGETQRFNIFTSNLILIPVTTLTLGFDYILSSKQGFQIDLYHVKLPVLTLGFKHGSRSPVKSPPRPPTVESISFSTAAAHHLNPSGCSLPIFSLKNVTHTHTSSDILLISCEQGFF